MAAGATLTFIAFLVAVGACTFFASVRIQEYAGTRVHLGSAGSALHRVRVAADAIPVVGALRRRVAENRRREALRSCLPETLRLLSSSLASGGSLVQALRYAAHHSKEPLREELTRAVWDLEAGKGFSESMAGLRERTKAPEFAYLAVAMEVQHMTGGSLSETIAAVSDSLRQTAELEDELNTKTAQGRLSVRIVSFMPVALVAVLSLFSYDYMAGFFSSPLGLVLFVAAVLLELLGIALVKRTLAVDTGESRGGAL